MEDPLSMLVTAGSGGKGVALPPPFSLSIVFGHFQLNYMFVLLLLE
jgi:hypothetical protein